MPRFIEIEKVAFSASILGAIPLFLFGFVTFRPNRLVTGKPVSLWETTGGLGNIIAIFWVALVFLAVIRLTERTRHSFLGLIAAALLPALFLLAGAHASLVAETQGAITRVSFGPGFWFSLFALAVILTNSIQRCREARAVIWVGLTVSGAVCLMLLVSGQLDSLSLMREFAHRKTRFFGELKTHLILAISSVAMAFLIGFPLGVIAQRKRALRTPAFFFLNTLQTVPSLALFGILIPILAALVARFPFLGEMGISGIGTAPALIALTVYSLLPVARNTYTGFSTVDPAAVEAGLGMGMTSIQLLWKVELPIASPIILNGIRIALVQAIGLTAVAALIGAGGFGVFIFQGLGQAATDLILLGAIPTIVVAVTADAVMNGIITGIQPKGLR